MDAGKKTAIDQILECPICHNQLKEPTTLQKCLHSYCKSCIDGVKKTNPEGINGWNCPMCNNFSGEEEIKPNFFISDLIGIHSSDQKTTTKPICRSCDKNIEASWQCIDCKIFLCSDCQNTHLWIPLLKGHRVVGIDTEVEKIVDRLVFCPIHEDKPIEFNCKHCEIPLCITCKVTEHDTHKTETIATALDRLLPELEQNKEIVNGNLQNVEAQIGAIKTEIEQVKDEFSKCRDKMDERLSQVIDKVKEIKAEMETKLNAREQKEIEKLGKIQGELENKLNEGMNLTQLADASTANARHATLLNEVQGGLYQKVQEHSKNLQQEINIKTAKVAFGEVVQIETKLNELKSLCGDANVCDREIMIDISGASVEKQDECATRILNVEERNEMVETNNDAKVKQINYKNLNFGAVFGKPMTKVLEIVLDSWSNRISYIEGQICVCCYHTNEIKYFSEDGIESRVIKSIKLPFVMKKAHNRELIVASSNGIYTSNNDGVEWNKVCDGEFCDLSVHGNKFSALEFKEGKVVTYTFCEADKRWLLSNEIAIGNENIGNASTLVIHDENYLVELNKIKTCVKYSKYGVLQYQHQDNNTISLSDTDMKGNLLVVGFKSNKCYTLSLDDLSFHREYNIDAEYPRDVVIDSKMNVWILQGGKDENIRLIKYQID